MVIKSQRAAAQLNNKSEVHVRKDVKHLSIPQLYTY